jgi:nucleoside-diphosphate-sugar epimerase
VILNKLLRANTSLEGRTALITGVGGFLGRALSKYLLQCGARVIGLGTREVPEGLPEGIDYYQTDILKFDELYRTLQCLRIESLIVFHLAGQSSVERSHVDPLSSWSVNVTGTAHLLEACRRTAITQIVFPSTTLLYARLPHTPSTETDPIHVSSMYASTKLAAEALLKSYSLDFGFTCRIARIGNVYGPGGSAGTIVGIILKQVKNGGPITLKTLSPIRDFIYRDDVVSGLAAISVCSTESGCEIFNLSSGVPISIRMLVETACEIGGIKAEIIETEPQSARAIDHLAISIERIKEYTSWRPLWKLEDGLRKTLSEMEPTKHG